MIITHFSKPNFDRQKPTLGKTYQTNIDGYLNFFLYCKKYFRLKSFWESLSILNHVAPTIFYNFWDPLSKLAVTVEVRSFDGTLQTITMTSFYRFYLRHWLLNLKVKKVKISNIKLFSHGSVKLAPQMNTGPKTLPKLVQLSRATKWRTCTGWWSGRRVRRGRGACLRAPSSPTISGCAWRTSAAGWDSRPSPSSGAGIRWSPQRETWARIFKLLRSPRIDSKEAIPPGCVSWRAGTGTTTTILFLFCS